MLAGPRRFFLGDGDGDERSCADVGRGDASFTETDLRQRYRPKASISPSRTRAEDKVAAVFLDGNGFGIGAGGARSPAVKDAADFLDGSGLGDEAGEDSVDDEDEDAIDRSELCAAIAGFA